MKKIACKQKYKRKYKIQKYKKKFGITKSNFKDKLYYYRLRGNLTNKKGSAHQEGIMCPHNIEFTVREVGKIDKFTQEIDINIFLSVTNETIQEKPQ